MRIIKSIANPFILHLIKLREDKKYRLEKNHCLIIGKKIVEEVAKKHKLISLISTNPQISIDPQSRFRRKSPQKNIW
jgi:hypothetical protein